MWIAEWKRLWKRKDILGILVLFFVLSGLQVFFVSRDTSIQQLNQDITILESTDLLSAQDAWKQATQIGCSDEGAARVSFVSSFQEMYEEEMTQLKQKKKSVIFSSAQNQKQLSYQLENDTFILSEPVTYTNDIVFSKVKEMSLYWNVFYLVVGFYVFYLLIQMDQESSLFSLYKTCQTTQLKILVSKISVCFLFLFCLFACKCGFDLFLLQMNHLPLDVILQQVYGMQMDSFHGTAGLYYLMFVSAKFLVVLFFLSFFLCIYFLCGNSVLAFLIVFLFLLIEILVNRYLPVNSGFQILKEINCWRVIAQNDLMDHFSFIGNNIFNIDTLVMLLHGILVVLLLCISCVLFIKHALVQLKFKKITIRSHSLFVYQFREVLIQRKGILVISFILLYSIFQILNYTVVRSSGEIQYEQFASQYYGIIDDTLLQRIQSDKQMILEASDAADNLMEETMNQGIPLDDDQAKAMEEYEKYRIHKNDILRVETEVDSLYEIGASYYMDNKVLNLLVQKENPVGLLLNQYLALIPLVILICGTLCPMYHTQENKLLFVTSVGKKRVLSGYFLCFLITGILLAGIVNGTFVYKIISNYTYRFVDMPVNTALGVSSSLSLSVWLALYCFNYLLTLVMVICVTMNITKKSGVITSSALMCIALVFGTAFPFGLEMTLKYDFLNALIPYVGVTCLELFVICILFIRILE